MKNPLSFLILAVSAALLLARATPLHGQEARVNKLSVSTPSAGEMAPVMRDSVLYFISNRKTTLLATYVDQNEELLYRVFSARLNPDSTLSSARNFEFNNQPRINNGPFTFSANGTTVIATLSQTRGRQNNRLNLYKSEYRQNSWSLFRRLRGELFTNSSMVHPALSPDGQRLYFASDREGGRGGTDLYMCRRQTDGWSEPENMGGRINTPGTELFPFVHPSGLLFFTSNGHHAGNDMNILYIDPDNPEATPQALPEPVNSAYDDFSCFIFPDNRRGYFASNRLGQDDLFEFTIPEPSCEPVPVVDDNFCFTFFENGPYKTDSLPIIYRWDFGDGTRADGLEADHCFEGPGNYHIVLNVIDTLTREPLPAVAVYDLELNHTRQIYFNLPDTIKTDNLITLQATPQGFDNEIVNPIYQWDLGDGTYQIGETLSHIYRKRGIYRVVCSVKINETETLCFYREVVVE